MPARRKPNQLLQDRRPSRRRSEPPAATMPIGNCPEHFSDAMRAAWTEVLALLPDHVAHAPDRLAVEQCCRLLIQSRSDAGLSMAGETLLRRCLADLGLSPPGRLALAQPLTPPADDGENPFAFLEK